LGASAALAPHVSGFIARTVPLYQNISISSNCPSLPSQTNTKSTPPTVRLQVANMSDQIQELIDIPRDFIKDGTMFINRCTKRKSPLGQASGLSVLHLHMLTEIADKREFIKISQAVGVGFLVMGGIYYPHLQVLERN